MKHALAVLFGLSALCCGILLTRPGATAARQASTIDVAPGRSAIAPDHTEAPTATVTCLGDSITAGFPYEGSGYTYPARLTGLLDSAYGVGATG
jgi:hypothetical protein